MKKRMAEKKREWLLKSTYESKSGTGGESDASVVSKTKSTKRKHSTSGFGSEAYMRRVNSLVFETSPNRIGLISTSNDSIAPEESAEIAAQVNTCFNCKRVQWN